MQQNLPPHAARDLILAHVTPFDSAHSEAVPLLQARGRVLAREVRAALDLPPFDNSAMDGYAVRAADLDGASPENPVALSCAGTIAAAPSREVLAVEPGCCVRIMTGAPLPAGAEAVVMREETDERDGSRIVFASGVEAGQNVRRRGEDIRRGEAAVEAGTRLRASEIALLAACGLAEVRVARRPRVAILSTGDELAEPGQVLEPGQIYNSNAFALSALVEECGALVVRCEHAGDDPLILAQKMVEAARGSDVLITSGGVSAGDFDPVRDVLLGAPGLPRIATPHFWKAAIKPGKPILFATLEAPGERALPIFALPGNPVSVAVTFELFVRPALLRTMGARNFERTVVAARVDIDGRSPEGKAEFVRAFVSQDGGGWRARVTGAQGSGRLSTMSRANALLEIPAHVSRYLAGDEFAARLLD